MTEFVSFPESTARYSLPFLVAGQAQKEFFVNEALERLDILLHPVVEGEVCDPPSSPQKGQAYLVATPATGAWIGQEDRIAGWDGNQWTFIDPTAQMNVFDKNLGRRRCFREGWNLPPEPVLPTGGSTIDSEAREAIETIVELLQQAGLISS
ncbi:DUF2793 domain-containing protein [Qipengyuania soli]|uniref:DUF2793 domain-containing protein n=1 Tax=Qipengyuania soli TaxID=2782568 RepID=A0A7S8F3Q0_9SPHN|nr:DUF2793 domain-containing protein [Qipengyuania soli]QPC98556.1 DUF2793 domain-containing protein [Qipengyuania soli]